MPRPRADADEPKVIGKCPNGCGLTLYFDRVQNCVRCLFCHYRDRR